MLVTRLILRNWRNFRSVDVQLGKRCYLIGANASGKSNLLDVFRFLRDITKASGGGLQKAVELRGDITRLRCLLAPADQAVRIEVHLSESADDPEPVWKYALAFKAEGRAAQRTVLTEETIHHRNQPEPILSRPDAQDHRDALRLTQTHLEQITSNAEFRAIAEHFQGTTYLHLVPQLLKHADEISGRMLEDDPFGQGLLQRIARTTPKTRDARLKRIRETLEKAVPQFSDLRFEKDDITGTPHLNACYKHWRPNGAWQREEQFSDGTLRLIGLLWALQDGDGLLLLEEPELSLNDAIVKRIPLMVDRVLRARRSERQVLISTHSQTLMAELADSRDVLLLVPTADGTRVRPADAEEQAQMAAGLNAAEVLLPKTRVQTADQLGLFP